MTWTRRGRLLLGFIVGAVLTTGCTGLPSLPSVPGLSPEKPGFATPTPGRVIDQQAVTQAVRELQAAAGTDEFWELNIYDTSRVTVVVSAGAGFVGYTWRKSGTVEEKEANVSGAVVPLKFSELDLPAILDRAQQSYEKFYDCAIWIKSVGYQGQITTWCDGDHDQILTMDLTEMRPDFSSAQAMADTFALMARGAPDQITGWSMSGPQDPGLAVDFADSSDRGNVRLSVRGMSMLSGSTGETFRYDLFDAQYLYPCAQQMLATSGWSGWHAWVSQQEDGTLRLYWDINKMWDPDQTRSITNERCEVQAP